METLAGSPIQLRDAPSN